MAGMVTANQGVNRDAAHAIIDDVVNHADIGDGNLQTIGELTQTSL